MWTGSLDRKTRRASASRAGSGPQPGAHPMSQGTGSFRDYLWELSIMLYGLTLSRLKMKNPQCGNPMISQLLLLRKKLQMIFFLNLKK